MEKETKRAGGSGKPRKKAGGKTSLPALVEGANIVKPKEVVESYIFSSSRRNLSIYSERLLFRLVELAQRQVQGLKFRDSYDIGQVSVGPLGEAEIEIPIRNLLGPGNTNYVQARNAIMELMSRPYFVETTKMKNGEPVYDENGEMQFEFIGHQILNDCKVDVKPGIAQVTVNKNTWREILNFSKGFRRFDLNAAMMLTKKCSARMFRLVSNQSSPVTYSIMDLRKMWGLENVYAKTTDFIKRTIVEAKEELDEKAPWSFEFVTNCSESSEENRGRRGRKEITSVTFFPVRRIANMSVGQVVGQLDSPLMTLGRELYDLLLNKFEFTVQGLRNNMLVFVTAKDVGMDVYQFLYDIAPKALRATNRPGYVIGSIERKLKEDFGVRKVPGGFALPGEE